MVLIGIGCAGNIALFFLSTWLAAAPRTDTVAYALEVLGWLQYFLWGAVGALITSGMKNGGWQMPRMVVKKEDDGDVRTYLDPGFLLTALGGGIIAHLIDGRPYTAAAFGATFGIFGLQMIQPLLEKILNRITTMEITFNHGKDLPLPDGPAAPPTNRRRTRPPDSGTNP